MRFWAGLAVLAIDELGCLPMPGEVTALNQAAEARVGLGAAGAEARIVAANPLGESRLLIWPDCGPGMQGSSVSRGPVAVP
jgi:hypothetical protein